MKCMKRLLLLVLVLGASAAIGSLLLVAQQGGGTSLDSMSKDSNQWVMPLGDYSGTRHSKLNQITAQNVSRLQVAWTMSLGTLRGQEGQPLVIGNMMYATTPMLKVVALDAATGKELWRYDPFEGTDERARDVNRGVAYWEDAKKTDQRILYGAEVGDRVTLDVDRSGAKRRLSLTFGEYHETQP